MSNLLSKSQFIKPFGELAFRTEYEMYKASFLCNQNKYPSYEEYLESDQWQGIKKVKLKEAEDKCQLCNASKDLQIHHRTYERLFNEKLTDLTVLCKDCHSRHHKIFPKFDKKILQYRLINGKA